MSMDIDLVTGEALLVFAVLHTPNKTSLSVQPGGLLLGQIA